MTVALEGGEWSAARPGRTLPPVKTRHPSYVQEAGWAPAPVWTGGNSRPHRDSIPDRPACSQSLYRPSYRPTNKSKYLPKSITVCLRYSLTFCCYIRPLPHFAFLFRNFFLHAKLIGMHLASSLPKYISHLPFIHIFKALSQNCFFLYVCLFVRMEQLCFHCNYFHEPSYFRIFRESVMETQFTLKFGRHNEQFAMKRV